MIGHLRSAVHCGARVFLCKHIHVGLNKCRPLVLWPELNGVCACWGGITLVAPPFFSLRYHCRSCCSLLSKIARKFFSSCLEALLTHSKVAQHFPLVREHLHPTNKSRVQKQPGASGCCHFWWQWRKERGQGWGNWWQMGFRRERGSSSKTAVEWLEPGEPTGVCASKAATISQ